MWNIKVLINSFKYLGPFKVIKDHPEYNYVELLQDQKIQQKTYRDKKPHKSEDDVMYRVD